MAPASAESEAETKNIFLRLLIEHWTIKPIAKSPAQEEREKYLFLFWKGIPFNRWMLFLSSLPIQFCCGSLYSWSNFNAPIDILIYGTKTANKAPNTFYIAIGMFGTTAMIMGPWLERNGPRRGIMLGSSVFAVGMAIASLSLHKKSIAGVYLGYGVLVGYGLGLNYISPVSALQKFFPDFRGVAAGFAVAGFGAGSIVWSKVYLPMIDAFGLAETFAVLGAILAGTMIFFSIVMRTPPENFTAGGMNVIGEKVSSHPQQQQVEGTSKEMVETADGKSHHQHHVQAEKNAKDIEALQSKAMAVAESPIVMSLIRSIRSPDFIVMYVMFFSCEIFGLVALSRLANMAQDLFGQSRTEGANFVSINGVFNCLGRLLLPMGSDFAIRFLKTNPPFARKFIFFISLVVQVIVVSMLPRLIDDDNYNGFRAVMWTLTFVYGGGFGTIPCFLTDMFGPYNIGALHGIILTALGIGGVGGGLGFTSVFDRYKPSAAEANVPGAFDDAYEKNFSWILAVLIVGLVLIFFVRTDPVDRTTPGWRYSICGKKIVHFQRRKKSQQESWVDGDPGSQPEPGSKSQATD